MQASRAGGDVSGLDGTYTPRFCVLVLRRLSRLWARMEYYSRGHLYKSRAGEMPSLPLSFEAPTRDSNDTLKYH